MTQSIASPALQRLASARLTLRLRLRRPRSPYQMARCSSHLSSPAAALPRLPIFQAIAQHKPESTAVIHSLSGRTFTYGGLLGDVRQARDRLREAGGREDLDGERIALLVENSYDYVVGLLAILAVRSIAVPLSPSFPAPELEYILNHSESSLLVSSPKFASKAQGALRTKLNTPPSHVEMPKHLGTSSHEHVPLEGDDPGGAGLMLYTSGTTNKPKGVLLPQSVLTAQARSLHQAWDYTPSDHLLHVLPLHHIHGVVNAILTPLFAGSSIEFLFPFNPDAVWRRLAEPFLPPSAGSGQDGAPARAHPDAPKVSFFTVVPTVYSRLLASHASLPDDVQRAAREAVSPPNLRVNISGSAALPTPIKQAWAALSGGNVLLERYGMTEVGMALSCGLHPADRVDASVGWPLPSVQARLVDVDSGDVIAPGEEVDARGRERSGEIQLRGPTIFKEYWRNPAATASEFMDENKEKDDDDRGGKADGTDGHKPGRWFKTGDVAVRRVVPGAGLNAAAQPWAQGPMYFIQGRKSADIIKTGGEKVSALEVERELLSLPQVAEAAVVALPSRTWGQKVGAVVVLNSGGDGGRPPKWSALDMRRALKPVLASYKIPQAMKVVDHIPRNAMGKINKKQLAQSVFSDEFSDDER
ncbi:Acyl-CoA synthetase family member 3 [Escovopsis weberi]|uniref:Acyl-CoA synthetase family member 3 n=1 Tax=Escovopsis weberi TaxID=150374 RepID=A0A0M8N1B7_ESCWE|nr:Acyl-CoA synthetase family member 3 [Escovopsis weberi]